MDFQWTFNGLFPMDFQWTFSNGLSMDFFQWTFSNGLSMDFFLTLRVSHYTMHYAPMHSLHLMSTPGQTWHCRRIICGPVNPGRQGTIGYYELDIIHSPALECPFAVMSNDIGLPLFFCMELMPL